MTESTLYDAEDYVRRVVGLLAKAEATEHEDEADMLVAKAQQIMLSHAISEELVRAAQTAKGEAQAPEEIVQREVSLTGVYRKAECDVVLNVAAVNDCRSIVCDKTWLKPQAYVVTVTGHKSDVENVIMLSTSLLIQHATAKKAWERSGGVQQWMSAMQKFKTRRQFTMSYAAGVKSRLDRARAEAKLVAATQAAKERQVAVVDATRSVAVALVARKERVDNWVDEKYGKSLRTVSRRYAPGSRDAHAAGFQAGTQADLGQPRVGGSRKALEG